MPQSIRNAQSSRAANQASSRFLCVLRVFAVKVLSRINRQDAKSAKKSAKKNSFQAAKDFRVSSTERTVVVGVTGFINWLKRRVAMSSLCPLRSNSFQVDDGLGAGLVICAVLDSHHDGMLAGREPADNTIKCLLVP